MTKILLFIVLLQLIGCASNRVAVDCSVPAEAMKKLQQQSIEFMTLNGFDTKCEEFSDTTEIVGKYGCGLYGNLTYADVNARTGQYCPEYLDGGYWVIFDQQTLKPEEIVLVAW